MPSDAIVSARRKATDNKESSHNGEFYFCKFSKWLFLLGLRGKVHLKTAVRENYACRCLGSSLLSVAFKSRALLFKGSISY